MRPFVLEAHGQTCLGAGALAFALTMLTGCGGNEFDVAPASGKVVCRDGAVTSGTVIFTPVAQGSEPGKPARGSVQSDGTFVLTTYDVGDGAIIGKHSVTYFPPEENEEEEEDEGPPAGEGGTAPAASNAAQMKQQELLMKNACTLPGEMIVEVTSEGPNEFKLELVPASPGQEQEQ